MNRYHVSRKQKVQCAPTRRSGLAEAHPTEPRSRLDPGILSALSTGFLLGSRSC